MIPILKGAGRTVATALLGRLGVVASAYLVTQGVPEELAKQVAMAAGVLAGLLFDAGVILYQASDR